MWCPAPLPKGEQHCRKLRLDKYKPLAGRPLEAYGSDSSVEADENTDVETGTYPDIGGAVKSRRRTRSTVGKKLASVVTTAISTVKAAEQKKRKRKVASPPAVVTPSILTPHSREVESEEEEDSDKEKERDEAVEELSVPEDRLARRSESPAAQRQRELVQKTSEEALRRGLEAQHTAVAVQARMPTAIKPQVFLAEESALGRDEVKS
jgi:hypothetical protein